ncbi:ATP-binding protein [Nocardia fusca]|uniref:Tetratricopeptide repeat protein n=1 Tax=Nocardia fusca TaxID=941183 RepID=A0ABV3FGV8_9NOCA
MVQARDVAGGIHFHTTGNKGIDRDSTTVPAQLPADVRGFVNRVADLAWMDNALNSDVSLHGSAQVCILTGTAGVGKTSLAVHWGHRVRDRFPDGQLYINLRGYDPGEPITADHALERFLTAIGVAPTAISGDLEDRSALFRSILARRKILVVLDNAATVKQVRPLLPGAGQSLAVVTSRSRLSGLVARDGAHRFNVEIFDEPAAVELLYGTVAGYRSGDSDHEIAELAGLCARLPLALRIAAERAAVRPHMPMAELIANLRDESHLWAALSTDDEDEADAVRTVFAWSYRALPPSAARMFRLLGLHPSPEFSVQAAAALAAVPDSEAARLLDTVVGAHLLNQIGHNRYQFHDLLRAYATDQVRHEDSAEDRQAALERVRAWYVHTMENCLFRLPKYMTLESPQEITLSKAPFGVRSRVFPNPASASEWLDVERFNLLACARSAFEAEDDLTAWQIPALLSGPFASLNAFDDWFLISNLGLEAARRSRNLEAEAFLLDSLTMAYRQAYRLEEAEATGQEALVRFRSINNFGGEARTSNLLALVYAQARRPDLAHENLSRAEELAELHGYESFLTLIKANRSWIYLQSGQHEEAYNEAHSILGSVDLQGGTQTAFHLLTYLALAAHGVGRYEEAAGWADMTLSAAPTIAVESFALLLYGNTQRDLGEFESAFTSYQRAAVISRRLGDRNREADTLDATGAAYALLGRSDEAIGFYRQAITLYNAGDNRWGAAVALDHLGHASLNAGRVDEATACWTEALRFIEDFDDVAANNLRRALLSSLERPTSPDSAS